MKKTKLFSLILLALFCSVGNVWAVDIYSTDVKATPETPATATSATGSFATTALSWASDYAYSFKTSGSAGYYTLNFSPALSLTAYTNVKVKVYWGAENNRPLNISVNGGSNTKIDEVTESGQRSKVRDAEGSISVTSLTSIKFVSSGGGAVAFFRVEITGSIAEPHTVTFNAGSYGTCGTTTLTEVSAGAGVTLPAVTPNNGYAFNGWYTASSAGTKVGDAGNNYKPSDNVTVYAQYSPIYKVTLLPSGGTTDDEDWTFENGAYTRNFVSGTEVTLPTFTKVGKVFSAWRNTDLEDATSTFSLMGNTTLIAAWATLNEDVIYSWEGAQGGAAEEGGIVEVSAGTKGTDIINTSSNTVAGTFYVIQLQSKNDADYGYTYITLNNALLEGDKIKISGFQNKNASDKIVNVKMIFYADETQKGNITEATDANWVNLHPDYSTGTEPQTKIFSVTSTLAGSNIIRIARSKSGTNLWINKIEVVRSSEEEETPVVSKTVTAAGWATFCSPYALDFSSAIANLEAAYLVTGATGDVVDLDEVTGTVPAGTGLLLKGKGDCTIPVVASSATNVSDNQLVGKTAEYSLPAGQGSVLLNGANGVCFYINPNHEFTVGANTAYLPLGFNSTGAPSAFRLVDEENNATNIENVEANETAVKFFENGQIYILRDGITYDALGRKVR